MEEMNKVNEVNEMNWFENVEGIYITNYVPVIRYSDSYFDN